VIPTEAARSRIAVFIDFDNVEIGVKSTIGGQFDIGLVLEAIKERGEIVTKIAYSDWKRVGDYSRLLTQHAIRMVQRNFTPGGDKNGADITMALDALEMAFTHDHINGFVIVGGDSDFISLVEKLKQYGRRVIVVGGRQFTSLTMQRNCHEFIAYENLVGTTSHRRQSDRGGRPAPAVAGGSPIANALPLVLRALKVLSEREVTPQLGLLKSTLLQLDSTFSEREYGASSFRDFMEKVAQTGAVELKHAGRSMLVEAVSGAAEAAAVAVPEAAPAAAAPAAVEASGNGLPPDAEADSEDEDETLPPSPMSMQDGIKAVQQAFNSQASAMRWPMYVRQARQFLRSAIAGFDERKYGFASVVDLLRAAGKEGVFRIERDRQGAVRVFPGPNLAGRPATDADAPVILDETVDIEVPPAHVVDAVVDVPSDRPLDNVVEGSLEPEPERIAHADMIEDSYLVPDGDVLDEDGPQPGNELHPPARPSAARKTKGGGGGRSRTPSRAPRGGTKTARPRSRKTTKS
jgi:uncharacterized protein (TIGR00288 family)